MPRMWIVVGDPTSGGDWTTCPKHNGVFTIVQSDLSIIIDAQPVALDGAHLACSCTVTTRLQSRVYLDSGAEVGGQLTDLAATGLPAITAPLSKPPALPRVPALRCRWRRAIAMSRMSTW